MVATIESVASVAGRGPQRDDGSQPWHYTRHWVYEKPNREGQNGNSGLGPTNAGWLI